MTSHSMLETSRGDLLLVATAAELVGLYFVGFDHVPPASSLGRPDPQNPVLLEAKKQLREYFDRKRTRFTLPLHVAGTPFQERIWQEIARIPYGQTLAYGELADRAGSPRAVRSAGTNTGRNRLGIVIPCHRVVGKDGGIGGFAGGLEWKRYLLELERSSRQPATLLPLEVELQVRLEIESPCVTT